MPRDHNQDGTDQDTPYTAECSPDLLPTPPGPGTAGRPSHDTRNWANPSQCPFCNAPLADGGPGFITHIESTPDCATQFNRWRSNIADDITGEWPG